MNEPLHHLLARQLRKLGLDAEHAPDSPAWAALLSVLDRTYRETDLDRYTQERAMKISSDEMKALHLREKSSYDARVRAIFVALSDLLWLKDEKGVYLACNPMFERFFGAPESEIVGKTDYDFVSRELADSFRVCDRIAMEAGSPSKNEEWVTFADDGHRALLETVKAPVRDASGNLIGVLGIARDITERKRVEEELRRYKEHLEEEVQQRTAELNSLFRAIPDLYFRMDTDGVILDFRAGHDEDLYLKPEQFLGRKMQEVLPPDIGRQFFDAIRQIAGGERISTIEYELPLPEGQQSFEARLLPLEAHQVVAVVRNITPLKQAQDELIRARDAAEAARREIELNESRLSAMLKLSESAQQMSERDLLQLGLEEAERLTASQIAYLHFINPDQDTIRLYTWSRNTLQYCNAAYDEHYPVSSAGIWADALRFRKPQIHNDYQSHEGRHGYPEGHAHLVRHMAIPVMQGDQVRMIVGVGNKAAPYDETDQLQLQLIGDSLLKIVSLRTTMKELETARDAAEAANRAKSIFLANMSHELRTPLNAILGFSSMLQNNPDLSRDQREEIAIINRSGSHLLTLINDVLEVAKIEAGRLALENTAFDLVRLEQDIVDMMRLRAEKQGLQLLTEEISPFPRYIYGDPARLRQILINLVGNAIKYTKQGGVTLRLGTRPNRETHLLIEVEDTGIGIAEKDRQRVFEPFVQLGEHAVSRGTGLGLTITRQFVQLMGGTIELESEPGKGSLFRITLPLHEATGADVTQTSGLEPRNVIGLAPDQPEYRILIAEDQPENQLLLGRLLADLGLPHQIAADGAQTVELFRDWKPHLILMDRRMPVMDGVEATRTIRELPGGNKVKIVAVTASAFKEQRDEMLASGMDAFVGKPYRPAEIYDCLAAQLGVKFLYEGGTKEEKPAAALTPQMLANLSEELRLELKEALESLDGGRIRQALHKVSEKDSALEASLAALADNYDYPAILTALSALNRETARNN